MKELSAQTDLRHLRAFVALARRLNFSRAADDLFLTQSAMSRIIAELERDVGTTLFVRDNRQVRITSAGSLLLPMAASIVEEVDLWIERSRRIARGELGAVHLGFYGPTFYKTPRLAEAHRIFKLRHPHVLVEVAELFSSEIPAALRSHRVDVAFGREIYNEPDIASHLLDTERLCAVLPQSHRLAQRDSIAISDLQNSRLVTFSRRLNPFVRRLEEAAALANVPLHIERELNQLHSILAAVATEHLVAIVPESSRPEPGGSFASVPFDDPHLTIPLVMSYLNGELSPPAGAFVAIITGPPA